MRREYKGAAQPAVLTLPLGGSTANLTITCDDLTNWPTGIAYPFYIVIDRDTPSEEKILCSARSGNVLTVYNVGGQNGRGADDTSVTAHNVNAVVEHVFTATDADEANAHVNNTTSAHGLTIADVVTVSATQTLSNKTISGSSNTLLNIPQSAVTNLVTDLGAINTSKVDYATPTNAQSGTTYTFVIADANRVTTATNAAAKTFTIPPQSSVAWADFTVIRVINYGVGSLSFAGGSGVTVTNAATTIRQYSGASLVRTGSNAWTVVPFGGSASAVFNEGSSSGATFSTLTNPDSDGLNYRLASFTTVGSHSLVISSRGYVQFLLASGGGSGGLNLNGYSGGGGAAVIAAELFLAAGTYPVVIGAGGAAVANGQNGNHGNNSTAFGITAPRGGGGTRNDGPVAGPSGGWYNQGGASNPVTSKITGSNVTYGNAVAAGVAGANGLLYVRTVV